MSLDDRTAQQQLTPEERRALLRAFADRMLLKVSNMDDPEDLPGVEKAVRTAAMIERIYSRCDRAERQKSEPRKRDAERAAHEEAAIKAQVSLASTLKWSEERRQGLGHWWEAAQKAIETPAPQAATSGQTSSTMPAMPKVIYTDMTDDFEAARTELALRKPVAAQPAQIPIPPLRGPPPRSG
ncbi:hypothetical protein [Asticcacaulis taihuensis]|uniref:hypothetical protein n=1 Tax=Asticcacaulis taihuensis TaxID=260084 RepID=UPI003F7B63EC